MIVTDIRVKVTTYLQLHRVTVTTVRHTLSFTWRNLFLPLLFYSAHVNSKFAWKARDVGKTRSSCWNNNKLITIPRYIYLQDIMKSR